MKTSRWRWVSEKAALAIHDEQIAEHGGLAGIRDMSLLCSALARPQNLAAYGKPDITDLAASYMVGIARNHPFLDGNKRVAWVVSETFLLRNGYEFAVDDGSGVTMMLRVAEGSTPEIEVAAWFRASIVRV